MTDDFRAEIDRIEGALRDRKVSVAEMCREAGIAHSTWTRWKSGATAPNHKTWQAVRAAVAMLTKPEEDAA